MPDTAQKDIDPARLTLAGSMNSFHRFEVET